jgi:hypothetical protein
MGADRPCCGNAGGFCRGVGVMVCDYRKMLIAYIRLVGDREGVDFMDTDAGPTEEFDGFTEEEEIEMAKIRDLGRLPAYRYYDENGTPIKGKA